MIKDALQLRKLINNNSISFNLKWTKFQNCLRRLTWNICPKLNKIFWLWLELRSICMWGKTSRTIWKLKKISSNRLKMSKEIFRVLINKWMRSNSGRKQLKLRGIGPRQLKVKLKDWKSWLRTLWESKKKLLTVCNSNTITSKMNSRVCHSPKQQRKSLVLTLLPYLIKFRQRSKISTPRSRVQLIPSLN